MGVFELINSLRMLITIATTLADLSSFSEVCTIIGGEILWLQSKKLV